MSRIVAVASGKGGVGKTVASLNIAHALASKGKNVLLVDGDLLTPNIHSYFGANDIVNSVHSVLSDSSTISEAIHNHESGLKVLPGNASIDDLRSPPDVKPYKKLLTNAKRMADIVVVDTGRGFSDDVIATLEASDEIVVLCSPDNASLESAKKTVLVSEDLRKSILGVVLNQTSPGKQHLSDDYVISQLGYPLIAKIPYDKTLKKSHKLNHPVTHSHPKSKSSKNFYDVANMLH